MPRVVRAATMHEGVARSPVDFTRSSSRRGPDGLRRWAMGSGATSRDFNVSTTGLHIDAQTVYASGS
jgi:hypothetical protein